MHKLLGAAVLLAALTGTATAQTRPAFPPNGTYVYSIFEGHKRVGSTTVIVLRRDALGSIDIYEYGTYNGATLKTHGRLRAGDLLPIEWDPAYHGPPFMSGYVGLPSILDEFAEPISIPITSDFWSHVLSEPVRRIDPKAALDRWPDDIGMGGTDYTLYYDPATKVVHEGLFPSTALGVHLESESKDTSGVSSFAP
jgi:hypothetical protein